MNHGVITKTTNMRVAVPYPQLARYAAQCCSGRLMDTDDFLAR